MASFVSVRWLHEEWKYGFAFAPITIWRGTRVVEKNDSFVRLRHWSLRDCRCHLIHPTLAEAAPVTNWCDYTMFYLFMRYAKAASSRMRQSTMCVQIISKCTENIFCSFCFKWSIEHRSIYRLFVCRNRNPHYHDKSKWDIFKLAIFQGGNTANAQWRSCRHSPGILAQKTLFIFSSVLDNAQWSNTRLSFSEGMNPWPNVPHIFLA